jgi:Spy/CpxP family protein refolding chaperone
MNKMKSLIIGSAVFAISAAGLSTMTTAVAQDGLGRGKKSFAAGGRMRGGFGGGAPIITLALKHKTELNLSGDQVGNLEKIRSAYQSQAKSLHEQSRSIEKEIASLMQQTPANLIQVKSRIQDSEKLRTELRYLRLEALENGKSVLTEQQREQLKTLLRSRHEQFRGRHGQPS